MKHRKCPFRANPLPSFTILAIVVFYMSTNFLHHNWTRDDPGRRGVIRWDVISYYSYLPATFIYGDVTLDFLDDPPEGFRNDDKFWPITLENGNRLIITSMGLSVLYAPFFFMAHALAPLFGEARDGFGSIYQFFLVFGALVYVILGLVVLKNLLLRYFKPRVTAVTLLAIAFGTNLLYYSTFEAAMSHSYNFFLIVLFMVTVIRWYEKPGVGWTLLTGALFGLIALVRPTNILVIFFLVLWDVKSWREFTARTGFFFRKFHLVLLMMAAFIMVWIPQLLYWKALTGQYFFFSYGAKGDAFYFLQPQVLNSLFSYKKGWFVYTPMMLLAVAGIPILWRRLRQFFFPVLLLLLSMIYVQSSWWCWWFGGGFGLRAYIDIYGIMAIPLAVMVEVILLRSRKFFRVAGIFLIAALVAFQLINTYQYWKRVIHHDGMNRQVYWKSFLRLKPPDGIQELMTIPDSDLAMKGIYVACYAGDQYREIAEMEPGKAIGRVKEMIREDPRLVRQIGRYARRNGVETEDAFSRVAESMYFRMIEKPESAR
ncbi:MAG TPA: hypothetical protein ENO20_01505 [Bacteroides sp.]|nr:hypothetical protein [Bacteroides sp.]